MLKYPHYRKHPGIEDKQSGKTSKQRTIRKCAQCVFSIAAMRPERSDAQTPLQLQPNRQGELEQRAGKLQETLWEHMQAKARSVRCVFPTFPELSVEVVRVLPPVVDFCSLLPAPQRREGLIGESGSPTCFHWNSGARWPCWRSGSKSCTYPSCSGLPSLPLTYAHVHEYTAGKNRNLNERSGVLLFIQCFWFFF